MSRWSFWGVTRDPPAPEPKREIPAAPPAKSAMKKVPEDDTKSPMHKQAQATEALPKPAPKTEKKPKAKPKSVAHAAAPTVVYVERRPKKMASSPAEAAAPPLEPVPVPQAGKPEAPSARYRMAFLRELPDDPDEPVDVVEPTADVPSPHVHTPPVDDAVAPPVDAVPVVSEAEKKDE